MMVNRELSCYCCFESRKVKARFEHVTRVCNAKSTWHNAILRHRKYDDSLGSRTKGTVVIDDVVFFLVVRLAA